MYQIWTESFGTQDPSKSNDAWAQSVESPEVVHSMKARLSLEGFHQGKDIGDLLKCYFPSKNEKKVDPSQLEKLVSMKQILSPCGNTKDWDQWISEIK